MSEALIATGIVAYLSAFVWGFYNMMAHKPPLPWRAPFCLGVALIGCGIYLGGVIVA